MSDQLLVLLYGEVIGTLDAHDRGEQPSFRYLPEYISSGRVALSARLPLAERAYSPDRVAPFLAGLLPENSLTRTRWAAERGTHENDAFGMLAEMGWDCPGAVQFCRPEDLSRLEARESDYHSVGEEEIGQRIRSLAADPASWAMPDEHWSLGGQQEKFALAEIGGTWHEAHGAAATTHIVKPGIRALHYQALVEHVTMRAAAALGIDIASTRMLRFEDQWAIVVERFDRVITADGAVLRLHQEDLCQALGRAPSRKYETSGGPGLRDMSALIQRQSSSPLDDRLALADFLIINVIAGAPDGHAKNISLLRLISETSIAPLYDLATGLAYDTQRVERATALSVGGERLYSRIFAKQWAKAAGIIGLAPDDIHARVAQLAGGFPRALESALAAVGDVPGAPEIAERALPAIRRHCQGILDRL